METAAAKIVVESMLEGMFAVLDALLARDFKYAPEASKELDEGELGGLLAEKPVVLRARIQRGLGAVAVLLPTDIAIALAAAIGDVAAGNTGALSEEETARLAEAVEPVLGGGVSRLMERCGRNVEQLEDSGIRPDGSGEVSDIAVYLGFGPTYALFSFEGGSDLSGSGALLVSHEVMELVPESAESEDASPMLSEAEMGDILSGFGPTPAAAEVREGRRAPSNLDMVLDIRLVATARLGRLEMPIGDILSLGPGSIIEMGQLVDEPVELLINDKLVARGDVVVVDEKFGLRITEIVSQQERIESLR
jgi:flagellar motor switch protein FliN/FliY